MKAERTSEMQPVTSEALQSFALGEWKVLREQMHLLLSAIWRLEMATIGGLAIYYGWTLTHISGIDSASVKFLLAFVPTLFVIAVIQRLRVEYAILMRLGEYCLLVEGLHYSSEKSSNLIGWQHYIDKDGNAPDDIPYEKVRTRYSHTFKFFKVVAWATSIAGLILLDIPIRAFEAAQCIWFYGTGLLP
jgi:hypothetical protein